MKPNSSGAERSVAGPADADLAQRVQQFLVSRRRELRGVSVDAECGNVRLSGAVASYHLKQLAYMLARHVHGVLGVLDELRVGASVRPPIESPAVVGFAAIESSVPAREQV
jgi:osmotically-inducible protein OsmY